MYEVTFEAKNKSGEVQIERDDEFDDVIVHAHTKEPAVNPLVTRLAMADMEMRKLSKTNPVDKTGEKPKVNETSYTSY